MLSRIYVGCRLQPYILPIWMNIQIAILGGFRPCVLAWDMKSWLFPVATWLKSLRGFQFSYYVGHISLAYDVHLFGLMRELWIILILCYIYKNIVIPLHTIQNIFTTDTFSGLFFYIGMYTSQADFCALSPYIPYKIFSSPSSIYNKKQKYANVIMNRKI
jgi:hypothetical protein